MYTYLVCSYESTYKHDCFRVCIITAELGYSVHNVSAHTGHTECLREREEGRTVLSYVVTPNLF